MKKGAGKRKGSSFERTVAKLIDKWWEVPEHTFWRSVNSGGVWEPGDITCRDKSVFFPFVIECKFYKTIDFWPLLLNDPNGLILKWWKKLIDDSKYVVIQKNGKTYPSIKLLIFKSNNRPIMAAFDRKNLEYFYEEETLHFLNVKHNAVYSIGNIGFEQSITIMTLSNFTDVIRKNLLI